ncbi:hypothetical protein [Gemmata sp.]
MLEAFQESLGLLDLEWFDDEYIYEPMQHALRARLAEYVRAHKAEFITG